MQQCSNCQTELPEGARFCFHCGAPQAAPSMEWEVGNYITLSDDLEQQLVNRFFEQLQQMVVEEQQADRSKLYAERVYASGFREMLHRRIEQLSEQLIAKSEDGKMLESTYEQAVKEVLEPMLDYFFIEYCKDLNSHPIPEAILQYQGKKLSEIDLFQFVLDYLDFANEKETVYTDFLKMPIEKLRNAGKMFLFPEKNERILLICDQSLLGSCKEGFALTEAAIYWKAYLQKPKVVHFKNLDAIVRDKEWLLINGSFFSVNPSFNVKMMKLLKKLKNYY